MQIGQFTIQGKAVLAPMAGVTDLPFRQLCLEHGAAMVTGEMTSSNPALRRTLKSRLRTAHNHTDLYQQTPRVVQIVGTDAVQMAEAAQYQVEQGAQIVDINMGCPAKKVCNKAAGSALLRDEKLVESILQTVVQEAEVPITLKIRTGWDQFSRNALTIAKIAEQCGIAALTIHGRTRACKFKGSAEFNTIAEVVQSVNIPVIANGDITSAKKAQEILHQTGAAAVMVGRGALGRPWIFNEINDLIEDSQVYCALFNGKSLNCNNAIALEGLIIKHLQMIDQFYSGIENDHFAEKRIRETANSAVPLAVKIARKHICWYFDQLKHIIAQHNSKENRLPENKQAAERIAAVFSRIDTARAEFNRLKNHNAQRDFVHAFFGNLQTTGDIAA